MSSPTVGAESTPDQPANGDTVAPSQIPPSADPAQVVQAYPFLAELASGKLPGLVIPKGWTNPATKVISPQVLGSLGIVFSQPRHDKDVVLALVNPKKIKRSEFDKLDKEGKLDKTFPSIAEFVPSVGASAPAVGSPDPNAPAASGSVATSEPSTGPVPTVQAPVGPGMGADANDQLAKQRLRTFAPQSPSDRPLAGQGSVINSLIKRAT